MNLYYTGFAMAVDADLLVNGERIDPNVPDIAVTAALVKLDRSGLAPGSAVVTCTKPGGTTVRATWSALETAAMTPGRYLIEYRTDDGPYCHEGSVIELIQGVAP
jgi:hypothetical protein